MVGLISGVRKNSLAADAGIKAGEKLCSVDGVQVKDIIELSFYTSDYEVDLEIVTLAQTTPITRFTQKDYPPISHALMYIQKNTQTLIIAFKFIPQFLTELLPATITVFSALSTR